jgi:hypothetical protein
MKKNKNYKKHLSLLTIEIYSFRFQRFRLRFFKTLIILAHTHFHMYFDHSQTFKSL